MRVDLYSAAGAKLNFQPVTGAAVLGFQYHAGLNEIGTFQLTAAATDSAAGNLAIAQQVWVYTDSEGLVFKGVIEDITDGVPVDGRATLKVMGRSIGAALAWDDTRLGRQFSADTLSDVVDTILADASFTVGEIASPSTVISTRFDGRSLWDALRFVAEVFNLSLRENVLNSTVDVAEFGQPCGITLRNLPQLSASQGTNSYVIPIKSISKRRYALDIVNTVTPIAQQTGVAGSSVWFDLSGTTRTSPYEVVSETHPDGQDHPYLQDADSVALYGVRRKTVQITNVLPLDTASASLVAAANTLYDSAVTYLQRHKDEQAEYTAEVVALSHVSDGTYRFKVGDTFKVEFEGTTEDASGTRAYLSVNANLYLMGFTRTFAADGSDTWQLTLSTILRDIPNDGNRTAEFMRQLEAVKGAPMPYVLFGDNAGRISETGMQLQVGALDAANLLVSPRSFSHTSADFQTTYARRWAYYDADTSEFVLFTDVQAEGLDYASIARLIWATNLDATDFTYDRLRKHDDLNFASSGLIYEIGIQSGAGVVGGLKRVSTSPERWAWMAYNNGQLKKVGSMDVLVKTADETVNNSTTLQNDDVLLIPIAANETIQFEGSLSISTGSTPGFKFAFTGPAGAVGSFAGTIDSGIVSAALGSSGGFTGISSLATVIFRGGVVNGGTAGNIQLQWAQNALNASDTTVRAGSYIKWQAQ